jgi:signal transduction histidine kinase/ActR/RegA family two-component response regulator
MKNWGVGGRVLFAAVVPATLIAIVLAWFFTYARIGDLDRQLRERGFSIVRQLALASEYGVFSGNREFLRLLTDSATREAGVTYVEIMDSSRLTLASSGEVGTAFEREKNLPDTLTQISGPGDALQFIAPVGLMPSLQDELLATELLDTRAAKAVRIGAVLVELSRSEVEGRKRDLITTASLITLVGLLIAGLLARALSRGVTQPILQLADTVARIKRGDLSARAAIEAGGSLKLLEVGINDMAASLQDAKANLEQRIADATAELQRQKEFAEQANQTKTQFLAAASHDLRQPVQAVGLFVSALRLRAKQDDLLQGISSIERALAALDAVLDGLLDISRLDAGMVTAQIEAFPLGRIFDGLHHTFSASAANLRLKLRIVDTAAWCRSDPHLLERILVNLVSNALRYTLKGGVCVGCRRRGERLRIEVWDTGIGIPDDKREEIFREFVQLGNPQRKREKGLGLGLAIVERLSKLLGHPLVFRSRPGQGTVFMLDVPRAPAGRLGLEVQGVESGTEALIGKRVLVVDDDRDVLEAFEAYLEQLGVTVAVAETEEEAYRQFAHTMPDVLLCDFKLCAERDGVVVIHDLRLHFDCNTPAAVVTGEAAEAALRRIADAGLPTLHKPVKAEDLSALLVALLGAGEPRAELPSPSMGDG